MDGVCWSEAAKIREKSCVGAGLGWAGLGWAPLLGDIVYLGREMKTFNETTTSLVFTTTRLHCPEYNILSMDIILLHKRGYPMIEK